MDRQPPQPADGRRYAFKGQPVSVNSPYSINRQLSGARVTPRWQMVARAVWGAVCIGVVFSVANFPAADLPWPASVFFHAILRFGGAPAYLGILIFPGVSWELACRFTPRDTPVPIELIRSAWRLGVLYCPAGVLTYYVLLIQLGTECRLFWRYTWWPDLWASTAAGITVATATIIGYDLITARKARHAKVQPA